MDTQGFLTRFWSDVAGQNKNELQRYFHPSAVIRWPNTNEVFSVEEFIRANCEYPGNWAGEVERCEVLGDLAITVTKVWSRNENLSFHAVSFFRLLNGTIAEVDEYWSEDGPAPSWRLDMNIGKALR